MQLVAAIGQQQQEPVRRRLAREEVEKLQRTLIAPMEIFDHQQQRSGGCGSQEDVRKRREEAALLLLRVQGEQGREACQFGQMLDLLRKQGNERACGDSQRSRDLGGGERGQEGQEQVNQGGIGAGTIGWEALTCEQPEVKNFGSPSQFGYQPRFANAGFPGQQHDASLPTCGGLEAVFERGQFCVAPDEDRADNGLLKRDRHRSAFSLVIALAPWLSYLSSTA